ncbi:hypothetical protein PI125_g5804 [Phytophthora idaei]|nr:hypothetical protein PI125_g5804 [Phytophthora idaei]
MSPPRRVLRTPHPFAERYNPVRALRDAPPLTSRYEEDQRDPNVITNDLDEAQSRQLSTEPSSQRSNPPVARPLTLPSRRDYGFQPRSCGDRTSCYAAALGHLCVWAIGRYG